MLAVVLGLSSSLCWGFADFLGGLQSRRVPVLAVLLVSQTAGLIGIAIGVAIGQPSVPDLLDLWPAAAAGLAGAAALGAFYRALAIGTMSIVAPITATSAALPVIVGIATGDRPSAVQVIGIAAAVIGVVLASRELDQDVPEKGGSARASIGLALVAALGFGVFFIGIKGGADVSVPWSLLVARATSVTAILFVVLAVRVPVPTAPQQLGKLAVVGVLDAGANGLYAAAATQGLLSVIAVLGALYPVVTVLLARVVLGERVRRVQEVGMIAALTGVALIAAG